MIEESGKYRYSRLRSSCAKPGHVRPGVPGRVSPIRAPKIAVWSSQSRPTALVLTKRKDGPQRSSVAQSGKDQKVDHRFRSVYVRRAAQIHTVSDVLESALADDGNIAPTGWRFAATLPTTTTPSSRCWHASRSLQTAMPMPLGHARRLAKLEPLPLLDMLVWSAGRWPLASAPLT